MKTPNKILLTTLSSCLLLVLVIGGVTMARWQAQGRRLPEVISKVKDLEVVGVSVRREGEPDAALVIEIRNKSDKAVTAFSVESGDEKDASGIDLNGDISDGQPVTVIEPYETRTVELPLGDVHAGKPVKVAGAVYADGSEDGDAVALSSMREHRNRDKAETLRRKGGSKQ